MCFDKQTLKTVCSCCFSISNRSDGNQINGVWPVRVCDRCFLYILCLWFFFFCCFFFHRQSGDFHFSISWHWRTRQTAKIEHFDLIWCFRKERSWFLVACLCCLLRAKRTHAHKLFSMPFYLKTFRHFRSLLLIRSCTLKSDAIIETHFHFVVIHFVSTELAFKIDVSFALAVTLEIINADLIHRMIERSFGFLLKNFCFLSLLLWIFRFIFYCLVLDYKFYSSKASKRIENEWMNSHAVRYFQWNRNCITLHFSLACGYYA